MEKIIRPNAEGFVVITTTKAEDDVVTIYEYENTNGCYVPPSTKLGLYRLGTQHSILITLIEQ